MVFVDETAVGVALPSIRSDLDMGITLSHWIPNAYLLAFAALAAGGGRLGDLFGRRHLFVAGRSSLGWHQLGVLWHRPAVFSWPAVPSKAWPRPR